MIFTCETATGWSTAGADTANIDVSTTRHSGSNSMSFDKSGTTLNFAGIRKNLLYPFDLAWFAQNGYKIELSHRHADYTSFTRIVLRLHFDVAFSPRYQDYYSTDLTGGQWNTLSVALDSPDFTGGSPGDVDRRAVEAIDVLVLTDSTAITFTEFLFDAVRIGSDKISSALRFPDDQNLVLPPFDIWNRNREIPTVQAEAQTAFQATKKLQKETIEFGLKQVRRVGDEDVAVYAMEDSLRRAREYMLDNQDWGVSYPANQVMDTTLNGGESQFSHNVTVDDAADATFIFDDVGLPAGIRVGPDTSRNVERYRMIGGGADIDILPSCGIAWPDETPVRSVGHYPELGAKKCDVTETGKTVSFHCKAVEVT